MHANRKVSFIYSLLLLPFVVFSTESIDWPQWRGPTRDGHAVAGEKEIGKLPAEPKVIWKVKTGAGLASPVLAGNFLVQFDAVAGMETLHGIERATGKTIWSTPIDHTFHDMQGPDGPRCTPIIDGDRVYAVSCRGRLQCLSLADGRKLWGTNYSDFGSVFIGEKGNTPGANRHGNNGTPLIVGNRLYACVGGPDGNGVVCFDKMTGSVIWKSQDDPAAYSPPVLAKLAGREHLVCFTAEGLIGLNPENGQLWWRMPVKTAYARHAVTPVWHEDVIVISSHQAGMIGIKISREGEGFKAEQAWLKQDLAMNFASPVAEGNYLYGLGPRKNLVCVEISSGKEMWSQDGYFNTSADRAYGGFLMIGSQILCLTDSGMLVLFDANPKEFVEHGTAQICGVNWCNPAYADGQLFLRDGNKKEGNLMCVELKQ